jgi:hypothetical protein
MRQDRLSRPSQAISSSTRLHRPLRRDVSMLDDQHVLECQAVPERIQCPQTQPNDQNSAIAAATTLPLA